MDNTQILWKPLLQFLGQLLAGLGQTGSSRNGCHMDIISTAGWVFFPFEKYASTLGFCPSTAA